MSYVTSLWDTLEALRLHSGEFLISEIVQSKMWKWTLSSRAWTLSHFTICGGSTDSKAEANFVQCLLNFLSSELSFIVTAVSSQSFLWFQPQSLSISPNSISEELYIMIWEKSGQDECLSFISGGTRKCRMFCKSRFEKEKRSNAVISWYFSWREQSSPWHRVISALWTGCSTYLLDHNFWRAICLTPLTIKRVRAPWTEQLSIFTWGEKKTTRTESFSPH